MVNSFPSRITQVRNRFNSLHPDLRKYLIYASAVLFVYALLVSCRITTSHTGIMTGSASEKSTILLGQPRQERSDEFLRGSPLVIASLRDIPPSFKTQLELTNYVQATGEVPVMKRLSGYIQTPEVLLNRLLTTVLPLEFAFAANWWTLQLLVFLALPAWFMLMGGKLSTSLACCISLFFVATSGWFSYLPLQLIGLSAAGLTYILLSFRFAQTTYNLWLRIIIISILSMFSAKNLISVAQYPPWGFPILLLAFSITIGWLLEAPDRLRPYWVALQLSFFGSATALITYLGDKSSYTASLDTVYPGQRRSVGGGGETPFLGGSLSWLMQTDSSRTKSFTNPEFAYGPTFLFLVSVVLCVLFWPHRKKLSGLLGSLLGAVALAITGIWGQSTWPDFLSKFNPLILVPGSRATMILGPMSVLLAYHAIATYARNNATEKPTTNFAGVAVVTALAVAFFTAEDVEWLRNNFYVGTPAWKGFISLTGASVICGLLILRTRRNFAVWLMTFAIVLGGLFVNPWTVGLGALNKSEAVDTLRQFSRENTTLRWASTGYYSDALIMTAAVPQLSGQQFLAPNKTEWRKIDPKDQFINFWNRGQSYVNFQLAPGYVFTIWNPSPDVIQVVGDPCDERFSKIHLNWYLTQGSVASDCLILRKSTMWMQGELLVYRVIPKGI
jgi:hypothetical protein